MMESVAEIQKFADLGMTIEDLKHRHHRRHHPDRIRTVCIPGPGKHSPASVRRLRASLGMSQSVFAELIGVSCILVQSWELTRVRTPSTLARRLLDTISDDPVRWLASLGRTVQTKPAGRDSRRQRLQSHRRFHAICAPHPAANRPKIPSTEMSSHFVASWCDGGDN